MTQEKRKYKRIRHAFNAQVKVIAKKQSTADTGVGTAINVSATGVLLKYDRPLAIGTALKIRFLKPNTFDFFEGDAKVVRVEMFPDGAYEIGVEFLALSAQELKRLDFYLTK